MNRSSFIKSIGLIFASPSIITQINAENKVVLKHIKKRAAFFKVSEEMFEDKKSIEHFIVECCNRAGIDINKDFNCQFGYDQDDFVKNCLTCVLTQYFE